jgi:hypothetical protein
MAKARLILLGAKGLLLCVWVLGTGKSPKVNSFIIDGAAAYFAGDNMSSSIASMSGEASNDAA